MPAARGTFGRRSLLGAALGLGPMAWASGGRAVAAAPGRPEIFGCGQWGARPPAGPVTVLDAPPRRIVVHHTATANVDDFSPEHAFALARAVQAHHMDGRGWIDTGQHFTVSRGGHTTEGRHRSLDELAGGRRQVRASHCVGQNDVAVGIEVEGTYTRTDPPAGQYEALAGLCAHVCDQYGLDPYGIDGHRDHNATACPGDRLYALLPRLREDVAARCRRGW
ncbi:peptidoglycan recognition family protein [Streptomyces sp. NPDC048507]|uniref:peptidoglycan recognition protein family protein n=1 Tax=Streptomyces sp. NPDC048507 TaxID=3365560 RepID=UPI0037194FB4